MARTALVTQDVDAAGHTPAYEAANVDGNMIDPGTWLHVKNGGAGICNVTVQTPATVEGLAVADRVIAVAAGAEALIAGLGAAYVRPTGGTDPDSIYVDYDVITSVTVGAFRAVRS